jgi:hypothetical protein
LGWVTYGSSRLTTHDFIVVAQYFNLTMRGWKKNSIKELEAVLAEFITISDQSKHDIHTDHKTYHALKKWINTPVFVTLMTFDG